MARKNRTKSTEEWKVRLVNEKFNLNRLWVGIQWLPPRCLLLLTVHFTYYNWKGTLHLAQGLKLRFFWVLFFSRVKCCTTLHHTTLLRTKKLHVFVASFGVCVCVFRLCHIKSLVYNTVQLFKVVRHGWSLAIHLSLLGVCVICVILVCIYLILLLFPSAVLILNLLAVQVVSTRTQPTQQSSGLALLERLLGQELLSAAWHLLIS